MSRRLIGTAAAAEARNEADLQRRGKPLQIKAKGNFTQKVEQDAYINLSVKYGLITLVNTKADLCEQMKEVDETCPLEGAKDFTKEVTLPKEIPPVSYSADSPNSICGS